MNHERKATMKPIKVKAGAMSVTVVLEENDANLPQELPLLLTRVREVIAWAGGNAALAGDKDSTVDGVLAAGLQ